MTKKIEFAGKCVFISGGTSGIGLEAGKRFASLGANVFAFSVDNENIQADAVSLFRQHALNDSQQFETATVNVMDREQVIDTLSTACRDVGAPFVLINSAGMGGAVVFEDESIERFDKMMRLNLYGIRNVTEACLPSMKEEGGHIVNISSFAGIIGNYGYTSYSASKFAVVGFTQALRAELKPQGIYASVMCPVQVDTPMLKETDQYKPDVTKAINSSAGVMTTEDVVDGMLKGIEKRKALIIPGSKGKLFNLVNRLFPGFRERMTDKVVRQSLNK